MKFFGTIESYADGAPYLFSWQHFLLMGILIGVCIVLPFFLKKISPKAKWWTIFTLWVIEVTLEFIKILANVIVEGYMDWKSTMPIHISSWFMYVTPFYLWGKGFVKDVARTFLCTMSLFGGLCNFFIPTTLNIYPVFCFFGLHTIFYHAIMVFIGMILWITEYRPKWTDPVLAFVPTVLASIVCIPVDYTQGWDYMFYLKGTGTPLAIINSAVPSWVYTAIIFVGYFLVTCIFTYIPMWIIHIVRKNRDDE